MEDTKQWGYGVQEFGPTIHDTVPTLICRCQTHSYAALIEAALQKQSCGYRFQACTPVGLRPETEPLGMRTNCLPDEKSLDLLMDHAWPIVARIAGDLMSTTAVHGPKTVQVAVKLAREIVAEAQKDKRGNPPNSKLFTINGELTNTESILFAFEPGRSSQIAALEVEQEFQLSESVTVRRIR